MTLFELIKKYMSGILEKKELDDLKQELPQSSDDELNVMLENIWQEYTAPSMDAAIKTNIKRELNQQIHPQRSYFTKWRTIAAAVLIPVLFLSTTYLFFNRPSLAVQEFQVYSAKGQKSVVYLPDGTKVWLNSDSYVSYDTEYNHIDRNILLNGEAFFEVEKNQEKLFLVNTGDLSIIVRGTSFNVSAYPYSQYITVSLNEGKVDIENNTNRSLLASLLPNQQLIIDRNDLSFEIKPCDAGLFSLWTQNKLRVENATTEEVFNKMEHWYGVNIRLENVNPENRYGFTIKTESLREMLDLINKLTPITYTITGEEVTIKYK